MSLGSKPWDEWPDDYDVHEGDALGHAFSMDRFTEQRDYMNEEEEPYDLHSDLDPLEQLLAEEEAEWEELEDGDD